MFLYGRTIIVLITISLIMSVLQGVQGKRQQKLQVRKMIPSLTEDELELMGKSDKSVKKLVYQPRPKDLRIFNPVEYLLNIKRDYLKKNQQEFQKQMHYQIIQRHEGKKIKKRTKPLK